MVSKRFIRVLFSVWADAKNVNAQSLNARDIALRLDPERFACTFFHSGVVDSRLLSKKNVRFKHVPSRLGSLAIAKEMLWGKHDILFYVQPNRASRIFWSFKGYGRSKKVVSTVESVIDRLTGRALAEYLSMLQRSDRCYAITDYIAERMAKDYGMTMPVIPVGVNLEIFRPRDRSKHRPPCRILFVGTLQPRKQPDLILELAEHLRHEQVEFHLIGGLIGYRAYHEKLLREKEEKGLGNVYFQGLMVQEKIAEWMGQSDVFVLPSRVEGLPKVTLEAAATGLPCIVFDDYQTPSVVDGVTGFQVKTFEQMLDRLRELVENPGLRQRMGAAAVEHAKKFDWNLIVKQWEQVFIDAVSR